jgi:drug/metabolite transporter (DMT)-like permease
MGREEAMPMVALPLPQAGQPCAGRNPSMWRWRRWGGATDTAADVPASSRRTTLLATCAALTATILGGSATVAARYVLPFSDPLSVTVLRNAGAMVLILALALATTRVRFKRADLPAVLALGVLQFGVMQFLFVAAFQYVPAARGALVLSTMPIITLALAALSRREQMTTLKVVGGLVAFAGVAIALGDRAGASGPEVWKGDALMFAAALSGAVYNVLAGSGLRKYPALSVTAVQLPAGVAVLLAATLIGGDLTAITQMPLQAWVAIAYLMSLGGVVSFFCWIWALERIAPSSVAITITVNPIAAAVLGAAILGEAITVHVLIGLAAVVVGIGLANWPTRRTVPAIAPGSSAGE